MTTREAIQHLRDKLGTLYDHREVEGITRVIMEDVLQWKPVDIVMRENDQLPSFFPARLDELI